MRRWAWRTPLDRDAVLELAGQYGVDLALTGHGADICRAALGTIDAEDPAPEPTPAEALGVYLAAVSVSNTKLARYMASVIERGGERAACEIDPVSWRVAQTLTAVCYGDNGLGLPTNLAVPEIETSHTALDMLSAHIEVKRCLTERGDDGGVLQQLKTCKAYDCELDIAGIVIRADSMLVELFDGSFAGADERDDEMTVVREALDVRGLKAMAIWVRMVLAARRLLSGLPVTDDAAFNELDRFAVRMRDNQIQLFGLLLEGWQSLAEGRPVNAKFRAVQVLKLAEESIAYMRDNALLLERAAYLRNTSMVSVREEAELLDISQTQVGGAEAWMVALHLACAGRDSDLAAWMSMNRAGILSHRIGSLRALPCIVWASRRPGFARSFPCASCRGTRCASSIWKGRASACSRPVRLKPLIPLTISRFACLVRFAPSATGFPSRTKCGAARRRRHLPSGLRWAWMHSSIVRRWPWSCGPMPSSIAPATTCTRRYRACGRLWDRAPDGKSCVLIQNECIGLNGDYVKTDVRLFDQISREVLGNRTGARGPHLVELCLKIEQLYAGPLYVPNGCNPTYFLRMRRIMQSKYIDCMIKGANAALEENDLQSAIWLAESGLRQETAREDMVRCAMRVYSAAGRRRDIVELYSGHMHHLREQVNGVPEPETRHLYERLVEGRLNRVLVER